MKIIEHNVSNAVYNGGRFSDGNTVVTTNDGKTSCFLHGNKIFTLDRKSNNFEWSDCCWATQTTASRLNACFDAVYRLTGMRWHYNYGRRCVYDTRTKLLKKSA